MTSKTKYIIENDEIKRLFESAGIQNVLNIAPLGEGEYNAVFSVGTENKDYVIKIAPHDDFPVMTLEKDLMASEVYWYKVIRDNTSIRVPEIYHVDLTKKLIPAGWFIMEKMPGQQLNKIKLNKTEKEFTTSLTAKMAAEIHNINNVNIKNDKFGYIQNELFDNWYLAIRSMVMAVISDAEVHKKKTINGERLLSFIDEHKLTLEAAPCTMVNFDLVPANIIYDKKDDVVSYAWIDPERSFWGDPIMDFICLEMMQPLEKKEISFAAYNSIADKPIYVTDSEKVRYSVAKGYLALIMEVERYFRYSPTYLGWWRNVLVSKLLYKSAFKDL